VRGPDGGRGAACETENDCEDGLHCSGAVCRPGVSGDACDLDEDCADGFRCLGSTCSAGNRGDTCAVDADCRGPELRCGLSGGSYRQCLGPGGADGDGCERNADCGTGLACEREWGYCSVPTTG